MTNNNQTKSNAHMVLATLTDEAASTMLNGMDFNTINDLVLLVGGEQSFDENYERVGKDGVIAVFGNFKPADIEDVYFKHKAELLRFCRNYADCVGKNSITDLVMDKLEPENSEYLEVGVVLHADREELAKLPKAYPVLSCILGIALSELCSAFEEMQIGSA